MQVENGEVSDSRLPHRALDQLAFGTDVLHRSHEFGVFVRTGDQANFTAGPHVILSTALLLLLIRSPSR